jgi:O-antigen/teichoic acid export membrane protein
VNTTRRVAKNTAAMSLSTAIRIFLGFAFTLYIGRTLGASWLGKFAILLAFLNIFQILAAFGIPPLVTREVARDRENTTRYFYNALLAQVMLGLGAGLLMIATAWFLGYPADTTLMLVAASLSVPLFAIAAAAGSILNAHERMEYQAIIEAVTSVLQMLALISVPLQQTGVVALAAIKVGGMAVSTSLYLFFLARLRVVGRPAFDLRLAWHLVRRALDLVLLALFDAFLFRVDILVLSKILDEASVGIYNAAQQLVKVAALLAMAYGEAIYPTLSRLHQTAPRFFLAAIRKSLQYGSMLLLAGQLIAFMYGSRGYEGSVLILQLLAWYMPAQFGYVVFSKALIASDQQHRARQVALSMVIAGLVYQLVFTVWLGAAGAAIGSVLTYVTGALLTRFFVARSVGSFRASVVFGKPVLAVAGMGVVVWLVHRQPLFVGVGVGVVCYATLLFLLRAFAREDWDLVRRIVSRRDSTRAFVAERPQPEESAIRQPVQE